MHEQPFMRSGLQRARLQPDEGLIRGLGPTTAAGLFGLDGSATDGGTNKCK